jgi:phosphate transport system protein
MSAMDRSRLFVGKPEIDARVSELFDAVVDGLAATTAAVVSGDISGVNDMQARCQASAARRGDLERSVTSHIARWAPMASELRYLVTVLRVAPELERSAELVEHIARRSDLVWRLPAELRAVFVEMGEIVTAMWRQAGKAWQSLDSSAAASLADHDDILDDLSHQVGPLVVEAGPDTPTAIEVALINRFYERLGDHAVHICERIRWASPSFPAA